MLKLCLITNEKVAKIVKKFLKNLDEKSEARRALLGRALSRRALLGRALLGRAL